MNSKPLIDHGRKMPVYTIHTGPGKGTQCVAKKDFEDLDAERRRLRQALIDRGIDPNDIPPVSVIEDVPNTAVINEKEMPKYLSHKVIWALKISRVQDTCNDQSDRFTLSFEDSNYSPVRKSRAWGLKFNPQVDGYYVVYVDGYSSFSPAKVFEEGYTRIP